VDHHAAETEVQRTVADEGNAQIAGIRLNDIRLELLPRGACPGPTQHKTEQNNYDFTHMIPPLCHSYHSIIIYTRIG
jgi:hypothetical protein